MSLGRRRPNQSKMFVSSFELPKSPGHPFYRKLNEVLKEAEFDRYAEDLCAPYYTRKGGRPSIPPGVFFRMLLVGYFEKIDSQRGIAWRCSDSLSVREFLGLGVDERSPDHSSLTVIRKRLPLEVFEDVFVFVLRVLVEKRLVKGRRVAVDSTTIEANAAMKSIVRRDTGESWQAYIRRLAQEEGGIEDPDDDDARRFDRGRKGKKTSNQDWKSPTDPDADILRMKDGRTRLGYKSEHAVDVESGALLDVAIYEGTASDGSTLVPAVIRSQTNLVRSGSSVAIEDVVADKGYHKVESLAHCEALGVRTYVPERKSRFKRRWRDKPSNFKRAFYANRRRVKGVHGRKLGRLRSEFPERSFAHLYDRGGLRRTWIRGLEEVSKRYLMQGAAANLGLLMRSLIGGGTPREWVARFCAILRSWSRALLHLRMLGSRADRFAEMVCKTRGRPSALSLTATA